MESLVSAGHSSKSLGGVFLGITPLFARPTAEALRGIY